MKWKYLLSSESYFRLSCYFNGEIFIRRYIQLKYAYLRLVYKQSVNFHNNNNCSFAYKQLALDGNCSIC